MSEFTTKSRRAALNRRAFIGSAAMGAAGLYVAGMPRVFAQDTRLTAIGSTVSTRHGRVRGLVLNGVQQFWGIQYGASTGGENRFMPPREPEAWSGVRDQFQIGNRCPQPPGGEPDPVVLALNRLETEGEDCLNLNVFTPGTDNRARPVMVWMHGGGFRAASGNMLMYDGTNLAKKEDVVVVAVTHRLNVFGYLHLADIGGDKWAEATNAGSRDLVAALRWVRDNIAAFGGDPDRVTIFGQSGGGGKTSSLMAVPSAEGLFHRAAAQSGSYIRGASTDRASEAAERFLATLGLDATQLDRLQQMPFTQLRDAYTASDVPGLAGGPVVDGAFLPRDPWDPTAPAYSADVPLLVGTTATENGWIGPPPYELSDEDMLSNFMRLTGGDRAGAENLIALYARKFPERRNQMLWLTAEADNSRRANAQTLATLKHAQGRAPAYLYLFDWFSPVHDDRMGSFHTLEIPFVFYNVDIAASMTGASQYRYQLGHVLSAAWAAFARTGNPNHADMPAWPAFTPERYSTMVFGDHVAVADDPNREERLALAAY